MAPTLREDPARINQGRKISPTCRAARWSREKFDATAETSHFADHLARSHLLGLAADGRPAFVIPDARVKNLPNQAEPVGDGTNGLRVPSRARSRR
jgi:hypothetical protein